MFFKILFLFNKKPICINKELKKVANKNELTQTMKLNHKLTQLIEKNKKIYDQII